MTTFFLGTHQPSWLARTAVPLFVSDVTLRKCKALPRAKGEWACDSGGFSELQMHGRWTVPASEYVGRVRRYRDEIGGLIWAAIQDWMCEPFMIEKTGLSIREHQLRTVESLVTLRSLAPELPWAPVLQGWVGGDYLDHAEMYEARGFNLQSERIVGVGSVCRRQHTINAARILSQLAENGLPLHGFGFKQQGLLQAAGSLVSADSLAWSYSARREPPMFGHDKPGPGRPRGHANCANCMDYALEWRERLVGRVERATRQKLLC